jgi:soluble lytic murein transglycosylase
MASTAQLLLICVSTLSLTPACTRAATTPATDAASPATATAIVYTESADPVVLSPEEQTDDALASVRRADREAGAAGGQLPALTPQEHMRRGAIYHANRAFDEARAHWQAVLARFRSDANAPMALFLVGRSLYQERRYDEALTNFERLAAEFGGTPAGRDGFYYVAATKLRLGRADEAAARYAEYIERFPNGERVEQSYLNIIDTLREAGRHDDAIPWVSRARQRFPGTVTDTNALFARLRLDVSRGDWESALRSGDELSRANFQRGVATTKNEVAYLRAYSLERLGRKEEAAAAYQSIPDSLSSYFGALATARLREFGGDARKSAAVREARVGSEAVRAVGDYPVPFREIILRSVRGRAVDPRLMLSIMRQESGFRPTAKSPAGARGLMQFTMDAAAKYAPAAGLNNMKEDDHYRPEVSISLAAAYLDELGKMFPGLPEAVAASYNGGEDNVARWVKRVGQKDNGVFTADIGFTESKDYAQKVLANLRAYQLLYTDKLTRK